MKRILFASTNAGKVKEVREFLSASNFEVLGLAELISPGGLLEGQTIPEVEETADSYHGNALLKARAYFNWSNIPTLADDSGLECQALDGAPGLLTARFAGENAGPAANRAKLLATLAGEPDRRARFVCVLCYYTQAHGYSFMEATLEGSIALQEKGQGGFGYDPIFIPNGELQTLAELKMLQEVETHRSRALQSFLNLLNEQKSAFK